MTVVIALKIITIIVMVIVIMTITVLEIRMAILMTTVILLVGRFELRIRRLYGGSEFLYQVANRNNRGNL